MSVGFIPLQRRDAEGTPPGDSAQRQTSQSLGSIWLRNGAAAGSTAIATYDEVWFSSEPVG